MTSPLPVPPPVAPATNQYAGRGTNILAILALVASFLIPPAGIVLGAVALKEIARTGQEGRGLALAGLWIGIVISALVLLFIALWLGIFFWVMSFFTTLSTTLPSSVPNA